VVFLSFVLLSSAQYCGPWIGIDWRQVPLAKPTDSILVYYMAAPLLYCTNLDEFTWVNGYHGGVGVVNQNTGAKFSFSFQGWPAFLGTFLPTITKFTNGTYDLKWHNAGRLFIYSGINTTYWHSLQQHVATMNGTTFNNFMQWISHANQTFTFYDPWSVYQSFPDKPLMKGFECFQWAVGAINKIKALGSTMMPGSDKLKVSIGNAFSNYKPTKVLITDPLWRDRITDFYLLLDEKFNELGLLGVLTELWEFVVDGDFFIRNNNDYYFVELAFPYFEMHWMALPTTGVVFN